MYSSPFDKYFPTVAHPCMAQQYNEGMRKGDFLSLRLEHLFLCTYRTKINPKISKHILIYQPIIIYQCNFSKNFIQSRRIFKRNEIYKNLFFQDNKYSFSRLASFSLIQTVIDYRLGIEGFESVEGTGNGN